MTAVHPESGSSISLLTDYRIRVCGRMDPAWSKLLQGMVVTVIEKPDRLTVTELCGRLPDQAALMGLLELLHNHAITVISVANMSVKPHRSD